MRTLFGRVPGWALRVNGDGDGYGHGSGHGSGDGDGSGYGYGSGYGDGDGSGENFERCKPSPVLVTADKLSGACPSAVIKFRHLFPNGAMWPADIVKAAQGGFDVSWPISNLGLLPEIAEE